MHYEWQVSERPSAMNTPYAALLATAGLLLAAGGEGIPSLSPSTADNPSIAMDADESANSTRLSVVSLRTAWSRRPASVLNASRATTPLGVAALPWVRSRRLYRTAKPDPDAVLATTTPSSVSRTFNGESDERGGRAVWSNPSENSAAGGGADYESDYDSYRKAHYSKPFDYNTSWWSSMQTGMPALGASVNSINSLLSSPGSSVRRVSHHHHPHRQYQPFVSAHWDDQDYGDYAAGGSQVVALAHPHHSHAPHQPVYYVNDHQSKDSSWNDLATKLIFVTIIKLLIVKAMGLTAFKLLTIGMIKVPIVLAAFGLKFAFLLKFFKFIKVLVAIIVIPVILLAIIPLLLPILIPLFLVLIPLVVLPLLLLFPVPVLTPGGTTGGGGGTVITITPGRRRREEEEQALTQLQNRVMDSRRCLQKLACDVGSRSQIAKPYADWVMWLLSYMKPILSENKRIQLKGFMAAYRSGLVGRSCYRKYPCYSQEQASSAAAAANASKSDAPDSELDEEDDEERSNEVGSGHGDVASIETTAPDSDSDDERQMGGSAARSGGNGTAV